MLYTLQDHDSDLLVPPTGTSPSSASPSVSSPSVASYSQSISSICSDLATSKPDVVVDVIPALPDTPPAAAASKNFGFEQDDAVQTELIVATMEPVRISAVDSRLRTIMGEKRRELTPLVVKLANRMEIDTEYIGKPFAQDFQARELVYAMCMTYLISVVIYCITRFVVS